MEHCLKHRPITDIKSNVCLFINIQPPKPAKNSAKADKKKEEAERKAREEGIACTNRFYMKTLHAFFS